MSQMRIPEHGTPAEAVLSDLCAARSDDADWRSGRTWSLVYFAGDEVLELAKKAYTAYFSENGLSPIAFKSLRRFENEVVAMTASMLHAPETSRGTMTSGGTESILMAVKAARNNARASHPEIDEPEILAPISVHPAFEKAAHYLGLKVVHIPVDADLRADTEAAASLLTANTVLVVGSAPSYPHGVVDPIPALAALAAEHGLPMHVDACLGGFLLPWLEKLGEPIPPWDFRVPGVTSISADLHKYGYAARGASTVLYRDADLRRHQFFAYADWPGGLYASPSMSGSRPGGAIAAAWAVLNHLGEDGYLRLAARVRDTTRRLLDGIGAIPELQILGEPVGSVFAFTSDALNVYVLGDCMTARGWALDRQQYPPALHQMVTPAHAEAVGAYLSDLRAAVAETLAMGDELASDGSAAMYGMAATIEDRGFVEEIAIEFIDQVFDLDGDPPL